MVFNVLGSNCDDHTKYFSFRLRKVRPQLAPAYDVTFAHHPKGEWTYQHRMSVNRKFRDLTQHDLLAEAGRFAVGTAPRVIAPVRAAMQQWPLFARRAGLSSGHTTLIADQLMLLRSQRGTMALPVTESSHRSRLGACDLFRSSLDGARSPRT